MDVEDIPPGRDFVRMLESEVRRCEVFLAVIGAKWLHGRPGATSPVLDEPSDFVRIEIEAALKHQKLIIPILVDGAEFPPTEALPSTIRALGHRNAFQLRHERFREDVQKLIEVIEQGLAEAQLERSKTQVLSFDELIRAHGGRSIATPEPEAFLQEDPPTVRLPPRASAADTLKDLPSKSFRPAGAQPRFPTEVTSVDEPGAGRGRVGPVSGVGTRRRPSRR